MLKGQGLLDMIPKMMLCVTTNDGFCDDWILDSANLFHMYANKELFDRYKSCDSCDVVTREMSLVWVP